MLSYQHGYHAGGFVDIIKHLTICLIFDYLKQKEKPFFYLDTHAGRGLYPLDDKKWLKTGEAEAGIIYLWSRRQQLSAHWQTYLQILETYNPGRHLTLYPGSPFFAAHCLRAEDRLTLFERHPQEVNALRAQPWPCSVSIRDTDSMANLLALLPPPERRGFIFIDPAFEDKKDYQNIPKIMQKALSRFSHGLYGLWYPIVDQFHHQQLCRKLAALPQESLQIEYAQAKPTAAQRMQRCGLWIINPPWTLKDNLQQAFASLPAGCAITLTLTEHGKTT